MNIDIESYIYRIINGYYFIDKNYKIVLPSISTKNAAHQLYLSIIEDNKFDTSSWITYKVINNLLEKYDIWNDTKEKELDLSNKKLDSLKIDLYLNFNNTSTRDFLKNSINETSRLINNLHSKKYYFDYLTLEHYAQNIKNQYLITNMVYSIDGKKIFDYNNLDNVNFSLLEKILTEIYKHTIDSICIKNIARHESWRSFWNISKENIFEGKVKDWTDEQRSLVNFSKVLDSIREHMDAPSEDVIQDDDALDGWILYQNQKNQQEKKKQQISDRYNLKDKKGNEVFILTNNKQEIETIFNLNDPQTKRDLLLANKLIDNKGIVNDTDLPHVKRDLQQQAKLRNK